jgi:hypothetical protein
MPIELPQPNSRRWTGPYLGNYYGDLWKTFNIDLEREEGKVCVARRMIRVADTTDTNSDTLGVITAFSKNNAGNTDLFWALSKSGPLYRATNPSDSWDVDTRASSPTDARDMSVHENDSDSAGGENILFVTRDTDVATLNDTASNAWNANWWVTTKAQTALRSGVPHPIEYFPLVRISLIGDGNKIHTIDKNKAVSNGRIILPVHLQAEYIFTTSLRVWILCSHKFSGNGAIVEWDGSSVTYNRLHDLYSQYPISGVNWNDVPIVVNHKGMILEYGSNGFVEMIRNGQEIAFPVLEEEGFSFSTISNDVTLPGRCMTIGGDGLVYINLNTPSSSDITSGNTNRQMAGIWCLNPQTGRLYNKYSIGEWGSHYGHQAIASNGALFGFDQALSGGGLLAGGRFYKTVSTTQTAIWTLEQQTSTTANRGHFITQYIHTSEIKDFWDYLWIHFKAFRDTSDRIVVKAMGVNPLVKSNGLPIDANPTWTSTTTFTATLAASSDIIQVGDEVEVMYGDNAGVTAHIIVISGAQGALQTFTIDETVIASTNTFQVRFERWKKLGVVSNTGIYQQRFNIGIDSSFIRFKVELRGSYKEMEISNLLTSLNSSIKKQ